MTAPIFLDFETRSRLDIRRCGGPAYVASDTSEILCGAALVDSVVYAWSPWAFAGFDPTPLAPVPVERLELRCAIGSGCDWPPEPVRDAAAERGVCAHNAEGFDRLAWESLGLPPVRWFDSVPRARRRGLPGKLDDIGNRLWGTGKDKAGQRVMHLLCKPRKGRLDPPGPAPLTALVRYCVRDVLLMALLWDEEQLGEPHMDDPVLELDVTINRRGIRVDAAYLAELRRVERTHAERAFAAAAAHGVDATMLRSPAALLKWLRAHGCRLPDVRSETVTQEIARRAAVR